MRIVEEARKWIGTPFKHQGRDHFGIDCVGHVGISVRAAGISCEDITNYPRNPYDGKLEKILRDRFGAPVRGLKVGDIVEIAFPNVSRHVGIIGDYPKGGLSLIHAWNGCSTVTEHILDDKWMKRIVAVYRPEIKGRD